jgi:hypothetical protein
MTRIAQELKLIPMKAIAAVGCHVYRSRTERHERNACPGDFGGYVLSSLSR